MGRLVTACAALLAGCGPGETAAYNVPAPVSERSAEPALPNCPPLKVEVGTCHAVEGRGVRCAVRAYLACRDGDAPPCGNLPYPVELYVGTLRCDAPETCELDGLLEMVRRLKKYPSNCLKPGRTF